MSWNDVFPNLSDDQVDEFQSLATEGELAELEELLGVARVVNSRKSLHLVVTSLFWKNALSSDPETPVPSREVMMEPFTPAAGARFQPWDHYVQPLLDGAALLREKRPETVLRVYLAADMEFLLDDLVDAGCEVFLMKSSSLRHNPGAMWRFLALDEASDRIVTVTDSDRTSNVMHDVERGEHAHAAGSGGWRLPYVTDYQRNGDQPGFYRPIAACHFGVCKAIPAGLLMRAFLWHTKRETIQNYCTLTLAPKVTTEVAIYGTEWPNYGFDEWFLLAAVYPRLAANGVLTFISWHAYPSPWFLLDVEYATWANPGSEVIHFGAPEFAEPEQPRQVPPPESHILPMLLSEKEEQQQGIVAAPSGIPKEPLTLVVARYKEKLDWILELEPDVRIYLYTKGPEVTDPRIVERVHHLEALENRGKESDTYLYHLETAPEPENDGWTVFCQGDPFPHSPDFLEMLSYRDTWQDVQPLTAGYMEMWNVPPHSFRTLHDEQWMGRLPIYTEQFSLHTMEPLGWRDENGTHIFNAYRHHHGLPRGWSIVGHFLESCGLTELAEKAWRSSLGQFGYGAQFGLRNDRLSRIPKHCLPRMREFGWDHETAGFVFERMWLHLFGWPFTKPARVDLHGNPILPCEGGARMKVVGAGLAGSVAARRLEDAGH